MRTSYLLFTFIVITFLTIACNKEETVLPPKKVNLQLPSTPHSYNSFSSDEVVTLGRVLFYDTHLSVNNSISCGTCHKQTLAFSDDVAFSHGFENKITERNTLPIQNLGFSNGGFGFINLFWDGRENSLNNMVLKPILNHVEMGIGTEQDIVNKVNSLPVYKELFQDAFGASVITIDFIAEALGAFVGSISSSNTLFDQHMFSSAPLSGLQEQGRQLFFGKYDCNSCHQTQQLNGYLSGGGFSNIGLNEDYRDNGVGNISDFTSDNGKFKIPNLRNIELTAPYMHDGRFNTLEEVIEHYNTGIKDHPNLDARLRDDDGKPKQMNISQHEKKALIAFLKTLTDYTMITDPKYSNPFKPE